MAEPHRLHPLTVEDYHAMTDAGILTEADRIELIDGQLVEKMTIGNKHIRIVNVLTRLAVERGGDAVEVSIQNPVTIDRFNEPEPDVVLLRCERDVTRRPAAEDVLLLIEVADSTLVLDKEIKLPRYAAAGIPEVWIVNIPDETIEVYRQPTPTLYTYTRVLDVSDAVDAECVPALGYIPVNSILSG